MSKIIIFILLFSCARFSLAQCGKPIILTSHKTEYLDENYSLQRSVDEISTIEIDKSEITVTPGNPQGKMTGVIKGGSCSWTRPFKDGKTVIKATFTKDGEGTRNATVTIEGKDGKVSFLMEIAEMPDRKIRVWADTFEEKK